MRTFETEVQTVSIYVVHFGMLNSSLVHRREVKNSAILSNAASIAVGHNYSSGRTDPSREDIQVTKWSQEACKIIGINLLGHIFV